VSGYITIGISKRLVIGFLLVMVVLLAVSFVLSSMDGGHAQVGSTPVHHQGPAPANPAQP
jgi:hypothetical protein